MIEAAIFVIFPLCLAIRGVLRSAHDDDPEPCLGDPAWRLPHRRASGRPWRSRRSACTSLAGRRIVFLACFALFALNVMGGGDAKLLTASAVWFGFNSVPDDVPHLCLDLRRRC